MMAVLLEAQRAGLRVAAMRCLALCSATQMNYLNRALDTFNTTMVTSVYYVYFTVSTVAASTIMYKDWENQTKKFQADIKASRDAARKAGTDLRLARGRGGAGL